jgi:chromosome partitioning protein
VFALTLTTIMITVISSTIESNMITEEFKAPSTHVIVLGNEKGGSGKSTLAIHLAVALMLEGMKVATIDLDARKQTLTHIVRNRRKWAGMQGIFLPTPEHHILESADHDTPRMNKWSDYEAFSRLLEGLKTRVDFIIIDTPSSHSELSVLAHASADTLLTPMNDSMLDIDVLANLTPIGTVSGVSPYTEVVRHAHKDRIVNDKVEIDWVVVRNRLNGTDGANHATVSTTLETLAKQLGFREAPGVTEQTIYREYFNMGLTGLDPVESFAGVTRPTVHHMASRNEILSLIESLNLPLSDRGRSRKQAQHVWRQSASLPLELMEILA